MFDATEVVPINFVFFTASAIIAGVFTFSLRDKSSKLRHLLIKIALVRSISFALVGTTVILFSVILEIIYIHKTLFLFLYLKSISVSAPDRNA